MHKDIQGLLVLQEEDIIRMQALHQLELIPHKIHHCNKEIDELQSSFEAGKKSLKEIEVEQKNTEVELRLAEELIVKYKTQQMSVKKNEDYEALSHQIDDTHKKIDLLENKDLECLMAIDEQKKALRNLEEETLEKVQTVKKHIQCLEDEQSKVQASIDAIKQAYEKAKSNISPEALHMYENIKRHVKKPKFIVFLDGHSCTGCHLRVSNDIVQEVLSKHQLACCDQCGRILYVED